MDARGLIDLVARHDLECFVHHAIGAAIAIMEGIAQERVVGSQQPKVHAPGIEADADQPVPVGLGGET
jgi:hypothetical protein